MIKYSIIIPVYNCEKYIEQCVESILSQEYHDYEVIIVDDCSTDNSFKLCKKYVDNYSNVILLRQPTNQGSSPARNRGIEKSKGKYILFVDGDDYLSKDYFNVIDSNINDYSFITFFHDSCIMKKDGSIEERKSGFFNDCISKNYKTNDIHNFLINTFFASSCDKVYNGQIIRENNIRFDASCVCYEDLLFNFEYIKYINKVTILKDSLYNYRVKETVKPVLKRQWGEPFLISKKVVLKIDEITQLELLKNEKSTLSLYGYTAFMSELQYLKLTSKDYKRYLHNVVKEPLFRKTIFALKKVGKKLFLLKFLLKIRFNNVAVKIVDGMIK